MDNLDETQRFTGAYDPGRALGDNAPKPNRQDTTIISAATGQKRTFRRGDLIDNTYELLELLGRGGMGIVFACRHRSMNKDYAIKLLSDDKLTTEAWSRFQAEAKALARLRHPSIVGIHNMGIHAGAYPYYVMDLLQGETLDVKITNSGKLAVREALSIFMQVTDALHSAHQQGIIHRDIKPSNLMLEYDPQSRRPHVKLMDFGIARLTKQDSSAQSQTATGLIFGTPFYMSPEQCLGKKADERSDIYSLGCALFEALTGRPPFCGASAFETFMMHQNKTPPTLAKAAPDGNFTDALEMVVATMLNKNPADRYQTMLQVQHDLERVKYNKPVREQGLVGITSDGTVKAGKRFDNQSKSVRLIMLISGFATAITAVWAIGAFVVMPKINHDRLEAELAKNRAAADTMAKLRQAMHTPYRKSTGGPQAAELNDERDRFNKDPKGTYTSFVTDEDLVNHGISAEEFEETTKFSYHDLGEEKKIFSNHLKNYLAKMSATQAVFRTEKPQPGFQFFDNISIGGIKVGDKKPVLATGFIAAPKNADVVLYLESATTETHLLDFFGPDDITGIEMVWPFHRPALKKFLTWNRLNKLSTFNSLIKAPLLLEQLDESSITDEDLLTIDQMSGLKTLGLCGRKITPAAIFRMNILPNLNTLMLKTVANIDEILVKLAPLGNLKELWLINEGMSDEQLKPLINLKTLQTLRIMRSPLTPESYKIFARIPNLKTLYLSTSWAPDEREKFKANLPKLQVTFERSSDLKFWVLVTKGQRTLTHPQAH